MNLITINGTEHLIQKPTLEIVKATKTHYYVRVEEEGKLSGDFRFGMRYLRTITPINPETGKPYQTGDLYRADCGECNGVGGLEVERIRPTHSGGCTTDGCANDCPQPEQYLELEGCGMCQTSGKIQYTIGEIKLKQYKEIVPIEFDSLNEKNVDSAKFLMGIDLDEYILISELETKVTA